MTITNDEPPVLGFGRGDTQMWTQFWLGLGETLKQRRLAGTGRFAFSDSEHAARVHDLAARVANPAVRLMDAAERAGWDRLAKPEPHWVEGPEGAVGVTVAAIGDRWGVAAEGRHRDGATTEIAFVSCQDETTAQRLAADLAVAGPGGVAKLRGFAQFATERAAFAQHAVQEPEGQRLARTAAVVHEVWPGGLAEAVTASDAFGALAWRLHEHELRGYPMAEVLGKLDLERVASGHTPAALAEWFIERMRLPGMNPDLEVLNLDNAATLDAATGPAIQNRPPAQNPAAAAPQEHLTPTPAAAEQPAAVRILAEHRDADQMVAAALAGQEALGAVQRSADYPSVLRLVHDFAEQGRQVERLLKDLPGDRIEAAKEPAQYLAGILRRRIEQDQPSRTGVDRVAMKELVRNGLPDKVADRVIACPAWPALARQLAEWDSQDLPVAEMMSTLTATPGVAGRIRQARKPAALTISELRRILSRQTQTRPSATRHTGAANAATEGRADVAAVEGDNADVRWADALDPASAIDRVGLEASVGLGSPDRNARLDQRLHAADVAAGASTSPGVVVDEDFTHVDPGTGDRSAGDRAAAAEQRDATIAAAARAEVTLTPDPNAAPPQPKRKPPARPVRTQQHSEVPGRRRSR